MTHARTVARRGEVDHATLFVVGGFALITASVLLSRNVAAVAAVVGLGTVLVAWHQELLRWPALLGLLISIVLFVPIGRYSIPLGLPFDMEMYRLAVGALLMAWASSLLIDPRVRLRRTPFDVPLLLILCAVAGSIALNLGRVSPLGAVVLKGLTFFLSFVLVYFFVVSVVRSTRTVASLTKLIVAGAAVVASFGAIEQRIRINIFDHVGTVLPFLHFDGSIGASRDGLIRAVASSSHPIELGVLLAMAVPLGVVLSFGFGRIWWIPTALIMLGVVSSVSRTAILVLVASGLVLMLLRPREIRRLFPLVVPLIIVIKIALPGSLVTIKNAFFPAGGLVQEQTQYRWDYDPLLAGGRVRLLGPSLDEASRTPLFGQGLATRQTGADNPLRNAPILDNQWLDLLLEIGLVGVVGFGVLLFSATRGLGRASKVRAGPDGWLAAGFAAAIVGFGVAMFTFDAFAFRQVTFVFWILLALSASLLLTEPDEAR